MSVFYPVFMRRHVTDITPEMLRSHNIKALLLDVDNTLTTHNHPEVGRGILGWMSHMRREGIHMMLISNNSDSRVRPFAGKLQIQYTANAAKPLPMGFLRAIKKLGLKNNQVAVVGDQIFTDILGGNLCGCLTILVEPMEHEEGPFFRFKRRLELNILRKYRSGRRN